MPMQNCSPTEKREGETGATVKTILFLCQKGIFSESETQPKIYLFEYQTIIPVGLKEGCKKSAVCSFTKNSMLQWIPKKRVDDTGSLLQLASSSGLWWC